MSYTPATPLVAWVIMWLGWKLARKTWRALKRLVSRPG